MTSHANESHNKGMVHVESHANRIAFATIPNMTNEQTLLTLININPVLVDPALKAMVVAKAAKLIDYYTKGLNPEGEDISKGCHSLTDGHLDDQEFEAALAIINSTFKEEGITLSPSQLPYQWPTSRIVEAQN